MHKCINVYIYIYIYHVAFLGYKGLLSLAESLKYLIKLETFKFSKLKIYLIIC